MKAKLIHIVVSDGEEGLVHATSPDLPGLRVTEKSHDELFAQIPIVIELLLDDQDIVAHRLEDYPGGLCWVVVPRAAPSEQQ